VHRIYRKLGLQLRPRRKRGVRYVRGNALPPATRPNERWSIDFVHGRLSTGRRFRCLTIIDDFTRECIAIETDFPFQSARVIAVFERIAKRRPRPPIIKSDNGGEFTSELMLTWSAEQRIELRFIEPGNRTRTPALRASTGGIATSSSTSARSRRSSTLGSRSKRGELTTTKADPHTQLSGLTHAQSMYRPPFSISLYSFATHPRDGYAA
jgi:putative transposase